MMIFDQPLTKGKLLKRYKRFLADVMLEDGRIVTAHCANSGSMTGLKDENSTVWLSPNTNPKAKLDWRWELASQDNIPVGINTSRPNAIIEQAIHDQKIPELCGYKTLKREVKYGQNSRIDILLSSPLHIESQNTQSDLCYVEIKSVTLHRPEKQQNNIQANQKIAEFPDAKTTRGTKHLYELSEMVRAGHRAVMLYLIQRSDCHALKLADDIDPDYKTAFEAAREIGVEMLCYDCDISENGILIRDKLPIII